MGESNLHVFCRFRFFLTNMERKKIAIVVFFYLIQAISISCVSMANIFEELLMSVDRLHTKNEIIMNKVENISFKQEEAFLMIHRIEEDTQVLKNEFNIVKKDVAKNDIKIDYLNNAQNDSRENIEKIVENIESVEDYLQNLKSSVGSMTAEIRNLDSNVAEAVENLFKTTNTTSFPSSSETQSFQKLYNDTEYEYFKVSVLNGTKLLKGAVSDTCKQVDMKAVCSGPTECKHTDEHCVITPLSNDCNNPMKPLSKILCDGKCPKGCSKFDRVFSYMAEWGGEECGSVGGRYCANGRSYTSGEIVQGESQTYFGYCAKEL